MDRLIQEPQKRLMEIIRGIPDDRAEKIMVTGRWSLRDTVAHLVSWVEEFEREIRYLVETGEKKLPWTISTRDSYAEWNQARIDEMKGLACSILMERFQASNNSLGELLSSLSGDQLKLAAEIPWYYPPRLAILDIISVKSYHEMHHIEKIAAMVKKQGVPHE